MATGVRKLSGDRARHVMEIGTIAGDTLARAIARGVYEATTLGDMVSYREQFGL
jgi:L-aminopeptidase/D-esterase-like protein